MPKNWEWNVPLGVYAAGYWAWLILTGIAAWSRTENFWEWSEFMGISIPFGLFWPIWMGLELFGVPYFPPIF
jgi:hypothetical protein